jgi:hypothetical protein
VPALDLLKKEPWVSEVAMFGDSLHVIGQEGIDLEQEVSQALGKQKIHLKRISRIRPSLEDVFVSLIHKEGRQ